MNFLDRIAIFLFFLAGYLLLFRILIVVEAIFERVSKNE